MTGDKQAFMILRKVHLRWVFLILLAFFLGRYLTTLDWEALARYTLKFEFLAAAVPFSIGARLLQPLGWAQIVAGMTARRLRYRVSIQIYARSWLGRYLPGKVGLIGGKVVFGRETGLQGGVLALSGLVEVLLHLATATGVALVLALSGAVDLSGGVVVLLGMVLGGLLALHHPFVLRHAAQGARRLMGRRQVGGTLDLGARSVASASAAFTAVHLLGLPAAFFLVKAVEPGLGWSLLPFVGGTVLLAGVLGTMAFFAPGGIGVRDGAIVVGLGTVLPKEVAFVAALVMRFWSIAMDMVFVGIGEVLAGRREQFLDRRH